MCMRPIMRLFEANTLEDTNPFGYQTGQLVQLKSGGPEMTVEGLAYNGKVQCTWFDNNMLVTARFMPGSLIPVQASAKDKPSKSRKNLAPSSSRRQPTHH